jgi:monoamine oxidase
MNHEPDIAIVGAGAAGVGAARRLANNGLSTVILEALPRLGGRAWTQRAAGVPLDLGCGWLHSADRNPWTRIAEETGFEVDRHTPAWGMQFRDLGFPALERDAARRAFARWNERLVATPPASDCAADVLLDADAKWTSYLQAMSGFISGDELEHISAKDYAAYDKASTYVNWRVPAGYGALVAAGLPASAEVQLDTAVEAISLEECRVALRTQAGTVRSRAAIVSVSTNVLAGGRIALPSALDPWREAATYLPLGNDEKLFLEIVGYGPFASESHVLGNPHDAATGTYYIRPFGWPVIECFLGGAGARAAAVDGADAAFARAIDQLVRLFGSGARCHVRPLIASDWAGSLTIRGAYSHALPGRADARIALSRPFEDRLFFAGEATHATDFSTAHGAYLSGIRAAEEAIAALAPR